MPNKLNWTNALILVIVLAVAACSPATTSQTGQNAPAPTAALAQAATATLPPAEATATTAPTNTEAPTLTATPLPPTATPTPQPSATSVLALAQNGISGWCLPQDVLISAASDPLNPPVKAQVGKIEKDALEIRNMPFSVCNFLYTFNQPAPSGLKLEIYDIGQKKAWWKVDLQPVNGKPETVYAQLRHTYIVDPPLWNVGYDFVVRDANGNELNRGRVNLHRWNPGLCFQQTNPDPVTLYCPLQQDLHPWDPGFGKNLPTVTPRP